VPNTRQTGEKAEFNITGKQTRTITHSPVYQPVNTISFWFIPVNIRKVKSRVIGLTPVTERSTSGKFEE